MFYFICWIEKLLGNTFHENLFFFFKTYNDRKVIHQLSENERNVECELAWIYWKWLKTFFFYFCFVHRNLCFETVATSISVEVIMWTIVNYSNTNTLWVFLWVDTSATLISYLLQFSFNCVCVSFNFIRKFRSKRNETKNRVL